MNDIHIRDTAQVRKGLVVDPEAKHYRRMRQAVWLYLYLLLAVPMGSGRRLLDPSRVASTMGISEATVRSWLGHLRAAGYLKTERQGRLIWIQLANPQGKASDRVPRPQRPELVKTVARPSAAAIELAQALGEPSDSPSIVDLLKNYSPDVLQAALKKVQAVPQDQIRVSRLALLRYLLKNN